MKRLFYAIDIVPGRTMLEAFNLIRHRLRLEKINWVAAEQMHITLAFLGDTEDGLIPGLIAGTEAMLARHGGFDITLAATGVFRNLHDPRVFWIGCDVAQELQQIKADLDSFLAGYGFEPENRAFSPHLTLGRIKGLRNPNQLAQVITLYKDTVFQCDAIRQIILYESRLRPAGPEYIPVRKFDLKKVTGDA